MACSDDSIKCDEESNQVACSDNSVLCAEQDNGKPSCSTDNTILKCNDDDDIVIKKLQARGGHVDPEPTASPSDVAPQIVGDIIDEIINATNAAKSRLSADHHDLYKRQDSTSTSTTTHTHSALSTYSQTVYTSTEPEATTTSTATSTSTVSTSTVMETVTGTGNPNAAVGMEQKILEDNPSAPSRRGDGLKVVPQI
ncbi:hypothetical protein H072_10397 [Dactylellina haptotyla CBS 200.50]|uniref:Uncharacterized protein n=1 Tax=Dactylellina haptotyla (strain CBS 200.50) TaxID=1284197 RepID=S8A4H8_DACHA|nr:hypothetical protein H072_10397 [Dactylellina haptotyla CBS 200.50]